MQIFEFILALVKLPAIVRGLLALVGLGAQPKPASDVLVGTVKTILGLLIMSVGIGALINALIPIQAMFEKGIPAGGFVAFVTFDEAVVSAVQAANVGEIGPGAGPTPHAQDHRQRRDRLRARTDPAQRVLRLGRQVRR